MIVQNNATWADNAYNGTNNAYYVEFVSATTPTSGCSGLRIDVTAATASAHSLTLANTPTGVAVGDTFKLRKHWTLGSLFGTTVTGPIAVGGGSSTTADTIIIWNSASQTLQSYYFKTSGLGGTGWRQAGGSTSTDMSGVDIYPDEGFLIGRKETSASSYLLLQSVLTGPIQIPLAVGINFVANPYPAPLPLSSFPVFGSPGYLGPVGLNGGTLTTADQVQIYNGSLLQSYYYKTSGLGGTGWRLGGGSTSTDQSSAAIPVGGMAIINHKTGSAFIWLLPQTF